MKRLAFSFAVALSAPAVAVACSSNDPGSGASTFGDAGTSDAGLPTCPDSIAIGKAIDPEGSRYAGSACTSSDVPKCSFHPLLASCNVRSATIFTCTCDGTSWTCEITGGSFNGATCDAGADAGFLDASAADASDASDADTD